MKQPIGYIAKVIFNNPAIKKKDIDIVESLLFSLSIKLKKYTNPQITKHKAGKLGM